jgi:hypothetical protein
LFRKALKILKKFDFCLWLYAEMIEKLVDSAFGGEGSKSPASVIFSPPSKICQKSTILGHPFSIEIRTLSSIISLKCADFLVLAGILVLGKVWFEGERGNLKV